MVTCLVVLDPFPPIGIGILEPSFDCFLIIIGCTVSSSTFFYVGSVDWDGLRDGARDSVGVD